MMKKLEFFTGRADIQNRLFAWISECDASLAQGTTSDKGAAVIYGDAGMGNLFSLLIFSFKSYFLQEKHLSWPSSSR
jgi:hypothetical protein